MLGQLRLATASGDCEVRRRRRRRVIADNHSHYYYIVLLLYTSGDVCAFRERCVYL